MFRNHIMPRNCSKEHTFVRQYSSLVHIPIPVFLHLHSSSFINFWLCEFLNFTFTRTNTIITTATIKYHHTNFRFLLPQRTFIKPADTAPRNDHESQQWLPLQQRLAGTQITTCGRVYPSHRLELHRKPCCEHVEATAIDKWTSYLEVNTNKTYVYIERQIELWSYVQPSKWPLYFEITLFTKGNAHEANTCNAFYLIVPWFQIRVCEEKSKINVCPSPWIFYILANLRF
jgi:hypothetical protein